MRKKLTASEKTLTGAKKLADKAHHALLTVLQPHQYKEVNAHTQAMALYFAALLDHHGQNLTGAEAAELLRWHALDLADNHLA